MLCFIEVVNRFDRGLHQVAEIELRQLGNAVKSKLQALLTVSKSNQYHQFDVIFLAAE